MTDLLICAAILAVGLLMGWCSNHMFKKRWRRTCDFSQSGLYHFLANLISVVGSVLTSVGLVCLLAIFLAWLKGMGVIL